LWRSIVVRAGQHVCGSVRGALALLRADRALRDRGDESGAGRTGGTRRDPPDELRERFAPRGVGSDAMALGRAGVGVEARDDGASQALGLQRGDARCRYCGWNR